MTRREVQFQSDQIRFGRRQYSDAANFRSQMCRSAILCRRNSCDPLSGGSIFKVGFDGF
jgi:hypothetical protein